MNDVNEMGTAHRLDPSILRAYDVRGIVGETLTTGDARALGRAFATTIRREGGARVALGYDGRLSSPDLAAAVADGLCAGGVDVLDIGRGPTPMLYFAVHETEADGGIQVTGSHNPPEHNGFKLMRGLETLHGDAIQELGRIAAEGAYTDGSGQRHAMPVHDRYVARVLADAPGRGGLRVAWDPGNGATGAVLAEVLAGLPGEHHVINGEVDGRFPAHHPDPTVPENLEQLRATVQERGCDLGFAFDGDGDRLGVVDRQGRVLWGDEIMLLIARDILADRPGAPIIADVKASRVLFDGIAEAGGEPVMGRTGHSLVKAEMRRRSAPFAGEMSAHLFFADRWYGFDDGLYAAVRVLDILARTDQDLAAFKDSLPAVANTPEIRIPCDGSRKWAAIAEAEQRLAEAGAQVTAIDGVRVDTADGWWLLRASNTQDVLVARCEGWDADALERLKAAVSDQLTRSGVAVPAELAA
ncbi:phosphomannomutase [Limimonas halophila]|uniref:Phosphomannomutase n=1 Tax=Limimonas halophila TaxID=1082479 RepID=A0A1G7NR04_9PROT|nr:phosphomannomutase/phosphoglucomutase [Limimonas halophila]SDF75729.1 phosphomannomutase [Limimonas halophila]